MKYFDIKGYFTADTSRLNKLDKSVFKTIIHNGVTETKKIKISNWGQELDQFIGADINRPAWKNSYTIISNDSTVVYKTKDKNLRVQQILIRRNNQKIKEITILALTENILYKTTEKLSYYPDSLYSIEKFQQVRLMGSNHYSIRGLLQY
ncbi:MAG: hypothetical protein ACXVJD_05190 [Mucilaginibacter sp.]